MRDNYAIILKMELEELIITRMKNPTSFVILLIVSLHEIVTFIIDIPFVFCIVYKRSLIRCDRSERTLL